MTSQLTAVYLGSSAEMTELLSHHFDIKGVVCEKTRINLQQFNLCSWLKIPYIAIAGRSEFHNKTLPKTEIGISYGSDIIFTHNEINQFPHGIWNIHPGLLPNYRGRHPVSWAMINGDKSIGVTIHKIDEKIDRGTLLSQGTIRRRMDDTQNEIETKVLQLVDRRLLSEAIDTALSGTGTDIGKGTYHPSLSKGFPNISPAQVDSGYLFNLLRSQFTFGGVTVDGSVYRSGYYYDAAFSSFFDGAIIVTCKDGIELGLFKEKKDL